MYIQDNMNVYENLFLLYNLWCYVSSLFPQSFTTVQVVSLICETFFFFFKSKAPCNFKQRIMM